MMVESVLLVGFNTRPLAYSLNQSGYEVYAVDFFGDLDLFPNVKDFKIVLKELDSTYDEIKRNYNSFLTKYCIELLRKYDKIDYLVIGSGLDDAIEERALILKEIRNKKHPLVNANNNLETIKKARDINFINEILEKWGYSIPSTVSINEFEEEMNKDKYPIILKKKFSSGGLNVFKLENKKDFSSFRKKLSINKLNSKNWILQSFIQGISVSCTVISNGSETEIISVNRQLIGEKFLNVPKDFMYCGNIVPANIDKNAEKLISEISIRLSNELGLRGINGFDYVLKNNDPYLMEINPRIPGSIRVSESSLKLNLLDLHLKSFDPDQWNNIKKIIRDSKYDCFTTKFIVFSPKELHNDLIRQVNKINNVHDKNPIDVTISKDAPLCSILFEADNYSKSYSGALKVVEEINRIIS